MPTKRTTSKLSYLNVNLADFDIDVPVLVLTEQSDGVGIIIIKDDKSDTIYNNVDDLDFREYDSLDGYLEYVGLTKEEFVEEFYGKKDSNISHFIRIKHISGSYKKTDTLWEEFY